MKIALLGYGKMGKTIEKLATEKGHSIVARVGSDSNYSGIEEADTAIEFSTPEAVIKNLETCFNLNIPVVCGTTGWLDKKDEMLKKCQAGNGSFIYASNFSVGVNIFFALNKKLAEMMSDHKDYNVSIEEIHHTQKLDAPSGTAITLAEGIIENSDYKNWKLDRADENEIPVKAIRKDDVKGTHIIAYKSEIDTLSISHEAHTRDGFALGAILAAEWLQNKQQGIYTMSDVLGL
ncbi:MAG: 4-hydroxy-tetrahydrodipicolinate reductase [Flavobacteriaceae bacterium]